MSTPATATQPLSIEVDADRMTADYWTTVTIPVLDAIGRLEEAGAAIDYTAASELSGVDEHSIALLVERLHREGDGKQWIDGAYMPGMGAGARDVDLRGLG